MPEPMSEGEKSKAGLSMERISSAVRPCKASI